MEVLNSLKVIRFCYTALASAQIYLHRAGEESYIKRGMLAQYGGLELCICRIFWVVCRIKEFGLHIWWEKVRALNWVPMKIYISRIRVDFRLICRIVFFFFQYCGFVDKLYCFCLLKSNCQRSAVEVAFNKLLFVYFPGEIYIFLDCVYLCSSKTAVSIKWIHGTFLMTCAIVDTRHFSWINAITKHTYICFKFQTYTIHIFTNNVLSWHKYIPYILNERYSSSRIFFVHRIQISCGFHFKISFYLEMN